MTCIVHFPGQSGRDTKKQLKGCLETLKLAHRVYIEDPSFFAGRSFTADQMKVGQSEIVTNHPKRSWFAKIERLAGGWRVT